MRVGQGSDEHLALQLAQPLEGPESVEPLVRVVGGGEDLPQGRRDARCFGLDQQPLGRLAPPLVGMTQGLDQLPGPRPVQIGSDAGETGSRRDAVEAPLVLPRIEVERRLDLVGDPLGVLDDVPIHVEEIERPVRPHGHVHRAEGAVAGREELDSLART